MMVPLQKRRYVTKLSFEDFKVLYPEAASKLQQQPFPHCYAVSWCNYPVLSDSGWAEAISIDNVKHIYSTRDYWEVHSGSGTLHKIPKRLTKAIYQIEVK